jgi:hypothetical protein
MEDLPDLVSAVSHSFKPLLRDGSQFTSMRFHPRSDGGIAFDSTVEPQQVRFHCCSIFAVEWLRKLEPVFPVTLFLWN